MERTRAEEQIDALLNVLMWNSREEHRISADKYRALARALARELFDAPWLSVLQQRIDEVQAARDVEWTTLNMDETMTKLLAPLFREIPENKDDLYEGYLDFGSHQGSGFWYGKPNMEKGEVWLVPLVVKDVWDMDDPQVEGMWCVEFEYFGKPSMETGKTYRCKLLFANYEH